MHANFNRHRLKRGKALLFTFLALFFLGAVITGLELSNTINLVDKHAATTNNEDRYAKTTSKSKSAQSDFKSGDTRSTETTGKREGVIIDKNGQTSALPPRNEWSTSTDGALTIYSPAQNALLRSGQSIQGTASTDRVYFRLSDNSTGVIAQGSIAVVSGKFAGTFDFTATGTEGELEIFNQAYDGRESSNVSVAVRYK